MQSTDDRELLRQYAENHSDDAFATLVTRHINLVYSVAFRRVGHPHQAEEITQAVFIILAKKALQLRHEKALSSWLFQATSLTAKNFARSEARRHRREQEAQMRSVLNESGKDDYWQRIAPLLDSAVAALNQKERQAIVLRFYEGRNLSEVGIATGASEEAARKRITRALEKLQRFFSKRGVASTPDAIAQTMLSNSIQVMPAALAKTVTAVALTKGSTASVSTLTLAKGALKIMELSKIKTAIAVSGIVLAVGGSTIAVEKLEHKSQSSASITEASVRRGLVLDYKFDRDIVDGRINDASEAGNNGQIFGARRVSDSQRGSVLQFSPPNQYVLVPNSASLNPSNLTVAAWIKTSNQGETWRRVFDKGWTDGFALSIVGGHKPGFTGDAEMEIEKTHVAHSNHSVADGRWHHVAVTYNGAEEIFYVDGISQTRTSWWQGIVPSNSHDLTIGINLVDPNPQLNEVGASFDGVMDEPMMFNRALLPDEIKLLFNSQRK
jgi:RNA polymerase sigma factor (sigma-70 family)